MVRRCAVESCGSTDINIVSHRFPRSQKAAAKWQAALGIKNISIENLIAKYVVCTLHFSRADYRNAQSNFLNSTAIPKLLEPPLVPPEDLQLMDILEGFYSKVKSANRKHHIEKSDPSDKTIMVYEINEIDDIQALQNTAEEQQQHQQPFQEAEEQQQQRQMDPDSEDVELIEGVDEENGLLMEYVSDNCNNNNKKHSLEEDSESLEYVMQTPKKIKTEPTSKYVRLENNVVIELGEEEQDEDEDDDDEEQIICYLDQRTNNSNHEENSLDGIFLKDSAVDPPQSVDQSDDDNVDQPIEALMESSKSATDEIVAILHEQIENDVDLDDLEEQEEEEEITAEFGDDYDEGEFAAYSRKDLIEKLLESKQKIHELQTKLETIEGAQAEMVKSIDNFKKIFSS